jgi:hypothetical protein
MTTANHLINALAAQDQDAANSAFEASIQERVSDFLEVRKVELASTIMDDLVQESYNDNVPELEGKKVPHYLEFRKGGKLHKDVIHAPASEDNARAHGVAMVKHKLKKGAIETLMRVKKSNPEAVRGHAEVMASRKKVEEGAGMDAQRRWVRQVAAIGKAGGMKSMHRADLKAAARKYYQSRQPHGAEFTDAGATAVRSARAYGKAQGKLPSLRKEETLEEGGPTRKHFQQVADLLKNIPDEAKRKELAQHHAGLFKSQNPRFDHKRFFAAAGVNEDTQLDEVLSGGSKPASAVASNAQLGRNVMTNIRRATQTLGLKGINPNMAAQGHKDFAKLVAKNPNAPGYQLLRKLAPAKAQAVQGLTQAGVPLGGALDAHPSEFNQVIQRIKRFK